ncbi:hypothetical protein H5410_064613 [Solanum commersonii]|uniref:Uncharacterized protein n=1 Tax=Solanum commersonii TaxID=4109 RepID=A0A9J5VYZ4_SOLCO|nr:hypothetical protein H5410_064613 [Solanum commersonii]
MEPPEVVKTVGRPKLKRDKVPDEAGKRKGEWSQSRNGSTMHCKKCAEPNHNTRGCYNTEVETQQSVYSTTQPYGPEIDIEEDSSLRPMVVSEVTRLEERKKKPKPTIGSRRIGFTGVASGVAATTLHQLQNGGKKKRLKMMVRKGQEILDNDDNDVNF